MNNNIAISLTGLKKSYNHTKAVDGITLEVNSGEIFGLLGPNGAGKSTLLSMLTGLVEPSCGELSILGKNHKNHGRELKRIVGIAPQGLTLYPTLTAYDNLQFYGGIYGLKGRLLRNRMTDVLDIVGLSDRSNDVVGTFSGGMMRRLNLAIALLHKPRILFLDEPTVGVDPQSRNAIFEAISELKKDELTIIYTTHYMEEADRLCDRIAIIDAGKIIALDTPAGLRSQVGQGYFQAGLVDGPIDMLIKELDQHAAVQKVQLIDSYLEIEALHLQEAIMAFMRAVNDTGVLISSLNVYETNLETVFLHLTGKKLRDE